MLGKKGEMMSQQKSSLETVIEIKDLTKDYEVGFLKKNKVRALDGLSLEVYRGEIFGFLGPNGAGKTTTLKLLMRLIYPTKGGASILGRPIEDSASRARIGYLPENPYFYDYLSGRELLEYTASLFGMPKDVSKKRAEELLQIVGLQGARAGRELRKYSKGMLQRVGIAQALVNDPEVIFMDEPMSGLDPIGRREVRDLMLSLRQQNKTIFFSSHILSDVEALCDRAAVLNKGKLIRSGTVDELTQSGSNGMEVVAVGVTASAFKDAARDFRSFERATDTPNGVQITLTDDSELDRAIALIKESQGKVVSVTPRRVSLEDVFTGAAIECAIPE
jgi:ABC-2 type transport system ATP-binding protein